MVLYHKYSTLQKNIKSQHFRCCRRHGHKYSILQKNIKSQPERCTESTRSKYSTLQKNIKSQLAFLAFNFVANIAHFKKMENFSRKAHGTAPGEVFFTIEKIIRLSEFLQYLHWNPLEKSDGSLLHGKLI